MHRTQIQLTETQAQALRAQARLQDRFTAGRRRLSLVDCTSFEIMRRHGITAALSLDADFAQQGFRLLPPVSASPRPSR